MEAHCITLEKWCSVNTRHIGNELKGTPAVTQQATNQALIFARVVKEAHCINPENWCSVNMRHISNDF